MRCLTFLEITSLVCSYSVQYVGLHPILMSILLYHYKRLRECISEVERIEVKINSKKKEGLQIEEEEKQEKEEEMATTLDGFLEK